MFPRLIKTQLAVFAVLTAVAVSVVTFNYLDLPRLLGFEQYPINVQFTSADGLYPGGTVTYRGIPVGKIHDVTFDAANVATAELSINDDVRIPAQLTARISSMSAIGEQSIDLIPAEATGPDLQPGAVIPPARTVALQPTAQLLDNLNGVAASVPKQQLTQLLDNVTTAFSSGPADLGPLLHSSNTILDQASANLGPTTSLLAGLHPFLDTQLNTGQDLRSYTRDLASLTDQLRTSDHDFRAVTNHGPPAFDQVSDIVDNVHSDLPYLLDDLTATGQVVKTYLPGLRQVLVIYPATVAALQSALTPPSADPGTVHLGLRPNIGQPPTCFTGFLPYANQRDFNDLTPRASIPNDLYCKVPQSDPRAPRGARNTPCFNAPGRRAASVEQCLGRPIGSMREFETTTGPHSSDVATGDDTTTARSPAAAALTYDPRSGRLLGPNGSLYQLLGVPAARTTEVTTWQQLLLK
jgi:phospholipid/cholesterol/gamma-HCH transport system substrate-binding protein